MTAEPGYDHVERSPRPNALELLLQVIPSKVAPVTEETVAQVIRRIYAAGIRPDWWKLEPMASAEGWPPPVPRSRRMPAIPRHRRAGP